MACINLHNNLVDAKQSDNLYKNRKLLKVYPSFFSCFDQFILHYVSRLMHTPRVRLTNALYNEGAVTWSCVLDVGTFCDCLCCICISRSSFLKAQNIGRYFKSSTKTDLLTFVTHNLLLIASIFNVECFYSYVTVCTSYRSELNVPVFRKQHNFCIWDCAHVLFSPHLANLAVCLQTDEDAKCSSNESLQA